jgi:serine/threonine protein kinase
MQVDIAGKTLSLKQEQVIGVGGEGTVFHVILDGQARAVKIYHTPTARQQKKLEEMLNRQWFLPEQKIAFPLQLVRDARKGHGIGLVMPYFAGTIEEIARLAHKKHHTLHQLSTRQVVSIFLDGAKTLNQIHHNSLVVGDLNDQNILYQGTTMLWVDVDAWQFATYPCPVACEDFLDPELYGIDLCARPAFKPEHDWYALAVHLFRSLLLVHPYGGTHKEVQLLTQRAAQRLFVLQPDIIYPKIAHSPDLLTDELTHTFERIFAQGWRGPFPLSVLQQYYESLVQCPSCSKDYPWSRGICPHCQSRQSTMMPQARVIHTGVRASVLFTTDGSIVYHKVQGQTVFALAYEHGQAVLYRYTPGSPLKRSILFKEIPGAQYALLHNTLIINPPETTDLLCIDVSGPHPRALCQAATSIFAGDRHALFQVSDTHLYTLLNHALIRNNITDGSLRSQALRTIMEQQTWFRVAPVESGDRPMILGYFQVFRQQLFWLLHSHQTYDIHIAPLEPEETLMDLAVYFSQQDILLRRHTQQQGIDYLHTEVLDKQGTVLFSAPRVRRSHHPYPSLHGSVYASGMLLHPSDDGIIQEHITRGTCKAFSATSAYVHADTILELYTAGLLLVDENQVLYLVQ